MKKSKYGSFRNSNVEYMYVGQSLSKVNYILFKQNFVLSVFDNDKIPNEQYRIRVHFSQKPIYFVHTTNLLEKKTPTKLGKGQMRRKNFT